MDKKEFIKKLIFQFLCLYGKFWESQFECSQEEKEGRLRVWEEIVTRNGEDAAEKALEKIFKGDTEFAKYPPTPLEFDKMCKIEKRLLRDEEERLKRLTNQSSEPVESKYTKKDIDKMVAEMKSKLTSHLM